jgi:ATP-binding protein involved in chromosome partitioning
MATSLLSSVTQALSTVKDPDLGKDLVTLNMIQDLKVTDHGEVSLRVVLTTPACPLKAQIEADVRRAVESVSGVKSVAIKMDAQVRGRATTVGAPQSTNAIAGVSHIIAVSSGKGGVGKSTCAVNLAMSLAKEGARVGIMDADVYGPNIPTMMGVTEQPRIENTPQGERFVPPSAYGIKVMSMGFLIQGDQPLVWRGPMLHSVVNQFCHQVDWGTLDYLIVDMPPGTGDVQLSLAQLVPVTGAVLVTTPQEVSMQDVRKAYHMFSKVRVPILGVIENMSYFEDDSGKRHHLFGKDGGKLLSKKFSLTFLGELPIVQQVREGGDEGRPIVDKNPESIVAKNFREISRKVAQQVSILALHGVDQGPSVEIGNFS